jgi:hypothetical protein
VQAIAFLIRSIYNACFIAAIASEQPGAGVGQKLKLNAFPKSPASREQERAQHDWSRAGKSQIMHARAQRKRSWKAVMGG